jgi:2-iminobutanoate/2-iminopropanoate deaminase
MNTVRSSKPSARTYVRTHSAPAAIGPYSQAVLIKDTLYCSGQIAIDPETSHLVSETLEGEAEQVLQNLGAVLRAASMSYEHVVHCTVYLQDINDYAVVNDVYARYFSEEPPARETVQVAGLPRGARVEIACVACR